MTNPADDAAARAAWGAMRIGDTERTSAMDALAEHLTVGRLTLDEYGERTAQVSVARTVDELAEQFADLPAPHPTLSPHLAGPQPHPATVVYPPAAAVSRPDAALADRRSRAQKIVAAAASASVFIAVALFFLTGTWLWFLLIPAISGIAKAVWGTDWNDQYPGNGRRREIGGGHR